MRSAFIDTLAGIAEADERVFLMTSDTGFHVLDDFRERFPERFLNAGISEAAMIGVAAGLAMEGWKVFVYGIAPFVSLRCLEQIRVDLCYHGLPVRIVGVGAGLTYGPEGATHHSVDDVGAMSALPGLAVASPGDPAEAAALVRASFEWPGPLYLRLGKSGEPMVHRGPIEQLGIGRALRIRRGRDVAVLASGNMLPAAAGAVDLLASRGMEPEFWSLPSIKPFDVRAVTGAASRCRLLATVEEGLPMGGLASRVAEVVAEGALGSRLLRFSLPDRFETRAAGRRTLDLDHGLTPDAIACRIVEAVGP